MKSHIQKFLSEIQELKDCKFDWIEETKGGRGNGVNWHWRCRHGLNCAVIEGHDKDVGLCSKYNRSS